MGILSKMLAQRAMWWARSTTGGMGKAATFATAVEIRVRWERGASEVPEALSERFAITSVVYVDRDVAVGDYLREGPDESGLGTDPRVEGAGEVVMFQRIPDLKAKKFLRIAYLA